MMVSFIFWGWLNTGLIKMRSWLGTRFMTFFRLIVRILTFRDKKYRILTFCQKVPYFNVLRQNRVVFNCFATKQCWGMLKMWGQPLFCNQPSTTATYLLLCISFMNNSQTKSSGYNKMQRWLIVWRWATMPYWRRGRGRMCLLSWWACPGRWWWKWIAKLLKSVRRRTAMNWCSFLSNKVNFGIQIHIAERFQLFLFPNMWDLQYMKWHN